MRERKRRKGLEMMEGMRKRRSEGKSQKLKGVTRSAIKERRQEGRTEGDTERRKGGKDG